MALAALGVTLYTRCLALGFVGDDFVLLDAARRVPLLELLSGRHGIPGYYRPLSRELYFWWWGRVVGLDTAGFHAVNALTYAAIVALLHAFLRRWLGTRPAILGALAFVLFPAGGALLSWVSCAQDLIAVLFCAAALLLYQRGRHRTAGLAAALAALSKETAATLPLALAAFEWIARPRAALRERAARLAPAFAGGAVAAAIAIAARATWPAGTAIAVWSPHQAAGAWRLPLDFAHTMLPPDIGAGLDAAWRETPLLPALAIGLAVLAVPGAARDRDAGQRRGEEGSPAARRGAAPAPAPSGNAAAASAARRAIAFGLALAFLGMLPVAVIIERWRGYFFAFAALGSSVAVGAILGRLRPGLARALAAGAALVNLGSNSTYRPLAASWGPARHPHANYAFFRQTSELSGRLLATLEPWCDSLRSVPRTLAADVPEEEPFKTLLGPALRLACRDTVSRVRFRSALDAADARSDLGVLRFDGRSASFVFERADAAARARIGEDLLLHRRYAVAAACLEAAGARRAGDPALGYLLAVSLAASGREPEARAIWPEAAARGSAALAARIAPGGRPPGAGPSRTTTDRLLRSALEDPWRAEAHSALGRHLLSLGFGREGALELAVGYGIGRQARDLFWLAEGYVTLGEAGEAREAYRRALALGLEPELADRAERRLLEPGAAPTVVTGP